MFILVYKTQNNIYTLIQLVVDAKGVYDAKRNVPNGKKINRKISEKNLKSKKR